MFKFCYFACKLLYIYKSACKYLKYANICYNVIFIIYFEKYSHSMQPFSFIISNDGCYTILQEIISVCFPSVVVKIYIFFTYSFNTSEYYGYITLNSEESEDRVANLFSALLFQIFLFLINKSNKCQSQDQEEPMHIVETSIIAKVHFLAKACLGYLLVVFCHTIVTSCEGTVGFW